MKLYNTLTKQKDDFKPLNEDKLRMYSCGPTLYGRAQIGNLASFIYADTLRRVFSAAGYDVKHVMNFTDVDDKTIKRSSEDFPNLDPNEALSKLTSTLEKDFLDDMKVIGNDTEAITFIRATDSIAQMQKLITALYKDGFAYIAEDGIYFSIDKYQKSGKKYGQLSKINSDNTSNERIDNDEYDKESVHDFVLWKKQKPGEPAWDFEIDGHAMKGRPGWHIECSAMSSHLLGQPFDIHTGGIDLIFPHHENEIAQSTAGQKKPVYATLFFHNEHLLVDGKKMSKSLGNFFTLQDIIDKGYDPLAFRLMTLQSHYRKPVNFTWKSLDAAQNLLKKLRNWSELRYQPEVLETRADQSELNQEIGKSVAIALGDDLNVPASLAFVNHLVDATLEKGIDQASLEDAVQSVDNLYGLNLAQARDIDSKAKSLLQKRSEARANNNWETSDNLRDELKTLGVDVRDTPKGQIWSRV
jgi:cysteinyl-tRNA synthetase